MKELILISFITIIFSSSAIQFIRIDKDDDLDSETREVYAGFAAKYLRNFKD